MIMNQNYKKMNIYIIACLLVLSHQQTAPVNSDCAADFKSYQFQCISQTCADRDLQKLKKLGIYEFIDGRDQATIYYKTLKQSNSLTINIYQYEEDINQFLEQPGCIQATIYSLKLSGLLDNSRILINSQGRPTWPTITKSFDKLTQNTIIQLRLTVSDLTTKCDRVYSNYFRLIDISCYFELAYEVNQMPQVQFFIEAYIQISNTVTDFFQTQISPLSENTQPALACVGTPNGNYYTINPESTLSFCSDLTCSYSQKTPIDQIQVNVNFWVVHQLTNSFFTQWKMIEGDIYFIAKGAQLKIIPISIENDTPGQIIYQLVCVLSMKQVKIIIKSGLIAQYGQERRLLSTQIILSNSRRVLEAEAYASSSTDVFDIKVNDQDEVTETEPEPKPDQDKGTDQQNDSQQNSQSSANINRGLSHSKVFLSLFILSYWMLFF